MVNVDEVQLVFLNKSVLSVCSLRKVCLALDHDELSVFSSRDIMVLALIFFSLLEHYGFSPYLGGHFAFTHGCTLGWYTEVSGYSAVCGQGPPSLIE